MQHGFPGDPGALINPRGFTIMRKMKKILFLPVFVLLFLGCDGSEPSSPVDLLVNALSPSEMQVTWEPAHEWQKIEYYRVYRDGSLYRQPAAPGFVDAGLSNATTYCYSVSACNDGNESARTGPECDTTFAVPDLADPSIPTGLIANALDSSRISLIWNASTDDVGVTGYTVYDADSQTEIDTVNALSFIHNGLSPDTLYCYYVTARDRAGKESTGSASDCAETEPEL